MENAMKIVKKGMAALAGKLGICLSLFVAVACNSGNRNAKTELEKLNWLIGT
jgi:hypothetical protein